MYLVFQALGDAADGVEHKEPDQSWDYEEDTIFKFSVQNQVAKVDGTDENASHVDQHNVVEKFIKFPNSLADERVAHARLLHGATNVSSERKSTLHFVADFCE